MSGAAIGRDARGFTTITRVHHIRPRDAQRCGRCPSRASLGREWVCLPFAATLEMGPRFAAMRCERCRRVGPEGGSEA